MTTYLPRFPHDTHPPLWDRIIVLLKRNGRDGLTAPQIGQVLGRSAGKQLTTMLRAGIVERRKGVGAFVYTIIAGGK